MQINQAGKPLISNSRNSLAAIIDVGKTRSKLFIVTHDGRIEYHSAVANRARTDGPYAHLDSERCWHWVLQALRDSGMAARVRRCIVVTHGAAFALLNGKTLAVPVMDYEFDGFDSVNAAYDNARDNFDHNHSPLLPQGLNAGRQIFYVQENLPAEFEKVTAIVPYPQYWATRLAGVVATEVTSLGSHTDLWNPAAGQYSQLVKSMAWQNRMPKLRSAWDQLGAVLPSVSAETGLPANCKVYCGLHDSNASYLRYLTDRESHLCVISTGTWVICMAAGETLNRLDAKRDMLANVDVFGNPVPCARFMGGREFEILTDGLATSQPVEMADAIAVMKADAFALPSFTESGGPFPGHAGNILNRPDNNAQRRALASLYCALLTDVCIDTLGASGELIVEGPFVNDAIFVEALAQFRAHQTLRVSDDESGTVCGAARLFDWPGKLPAPQQTYVAAGPASLFRNYRDRWRDLLRR